MAQSFAKILLHAVFSTKDRRPFLRDEPFREELHRYLGGILTNLGCQSLIIGGVEDHVHLLFALSRTATVADVVEESKRGSSVWLKTKSPALADFAWQNRAERDSQKAEPLPEGQRRMALAKDRIPRNSYYSCKAWMSREKPRSPWWLDDEPGRFLCRRTVRPKYVRRGALDALPIVAPLPEAILERSLIAPGLLAQILVSKYYDHLPLYRQEAIYWSRHQVWLPRQTMTHWQVQDLTPEAWARAHKRADGRAAA